MIRCTKCGREASSSEVRDVRTGRMVAVKVWCSCGTRERVEKRGAKVVVVQEQKR
jgi:hypothetical protein